MNVALWKGDGGVEATECSFVVVEFSERVVNFLLECHFCVYIRARILIFYLSDWLARKTPASMKVMVQFSVTNFV